MRGHSGVSHEGPANPSSHAHVHCHLSSTPFTQLLVHESTEIVVYIPLLSMSAVRSLITATPVQLFPSCRANQTCKHKEISGFSWMSLTRGDHLLGGIAT